MELIMNELSFDRQFQSCDDFVDYVLDTLAPILDIVIENRIPLLKKSDIYDWGVTPQETLGDILIMTNNPVISKIKQYIVNIAYTEPYWDLETRTNLNTIYEYPVSAQEPNCFTEAIERQCGLISLSHRDYFFGRVVCKRDEMDTELVNITRLEQFLKFYLLEDKTRVRYILEEYPYKRTVACVEINNRCYAEEALLGNNLLTEDIINIVDAISQLIEDLNHGRKSHLWDKLRDDIFELRMNVSDNRIFRLLFVQQDGLQFLNGFIKKVQKTPKGEIDRAVELKKYLS